jgi:hypothetical protein
MGPSFVVTRPAIEVGGLTEPAYFALRRTGELLARVRELVVLTSAAAARSAVRDARTSCGERFAALEMMEPVARLKWDGEQFGRAKA